MLEYNNDCSIGEKLHIEFEYRKNSIKPPWGAFLLSWERDLVKTGT